MSQTIPISVQRLRTVLHATVELLATRPCEIPSGRTRRRWWEKLNRMMIAWANYFCLGQSAKLTVRFRCMPAGGCVGGPATNIMSRRPGHKRFPEASLHYSVYGLVQLHADRFLHERKSINTNLLWLVDCCSCVPKSFLCCRSYLLRFPGFLSRVCGITRFRACPSHPGLPSRIPNCRLAFWLRCGRPD